MSALQRMRLLGRENVDDLCRYQADAEEAIENEAMEKRQTQSRASESATVGMLRAKVAELEKLLGERDIALADTVDALDAAIARIGPWAEKMVEAKLAGVRVEIATRFGEAIGRINALDPDRVRAKSTDATPFKFASERTEPDDGGRPALDLPRLAEIH